MIGISIVICCYNSANRLPDTLFKISQLNQSQNIPFEVIIVDNLSTDNTSQVAIIEWSKYKLNDIDFCIINEDKAGLNHARYKGALKAKYNWLLYCDDDNWLEYDYLTNFIKILESHQQLKMICCGVAEAYFEKRPNKWFYKYQHLCVVFNILEYGYEYRISKNINDVCDVCGAGMFITRDITIEYFNNQGYLISDRKGKQLNSGGDTDLVHYFLKNSYEIGQFSELRIKHFIPKERISRIYIFRLIEGMSYSNVLLSYKKNKVLEKPVLYKLGKSFIWQIFQLKVFTAFLTLANYLGKNRAYTELLQAEA